MVSILRSGYQVDSVNVICVAANLVLEDTVERIYHQDVFAEAWRGLFLIRGENVVLLGEIVSPS